MSEFQITLKHWEDWLHLCYPDYPVDREEELYLLDELSLMELEEALYGEDSE